MPCVTVTKEERFTYKNLRFVWSPLRVAQEMGSGVGDSPLLFRPLPEGEKITSVSRWCRDVLQRQHQFLADRMRISRERVYRGIAVNAVFQATQRGFINP